MKKIFGIVCLVLLWFNASLANNLKVIDGDTIRLNEAKIRFSGIDAPESNYKGKEQTCLINETVIRCGKLSKEFLIKIIGNNKVTCELEKKPDASIRNNIETSKAQCSNMIDPFSHKKCG